VVMLESLRALTTLQGSASRSRRPAAAVSAFVGAAAVPTKARILGCFGSGTWIRTNCRRQSSADAAGFVATGSAANGEQGVVVQHQPQITTFPPGSADAASRGHDPQAVLV
jgi:hypothetical protein